VVAGFIADYCGAHQRAKRMALAEQHILEEADRHLLTRYDLNQHLPEHDRGLLDDALNELEDRDLVEHEPISFRDSLGWRHTDQLYTARRFPGGQSPAR
jgi:hypothetical protein